MPSDNAPFVVGELLARLERAAPHAWAEPWDLVGLLSGDPGQVVTGVLVTLDATAEACERAAAAGADVLITHHPPYLTAPSRFERSPGPAGTAEASLRLGVSVVALHTNFDRFPQGAEALVRALGLEVTGALESAPEPISVVTTYVPQGAAVAVRAAMAAAGGGRVGEYEGCAFVSEGSGYFTPLPGARPVLVAPGGEGLAEERIEMMVPCDRVESVLNAAWAAHPYEEPVVLAVDGLRARGAARLGRMCAWRANATVDDLARHVSSALGVGVRVWGDASRPAGRIAVANGSAGSLIHDACARAETLVTGEVRYHDALAAVASGLAIIEAGHDASEWPLVGALGKLVSGLVPAAVAVQTERPCTIWSTTRETDG